jgi:rieske iron-sulfur protein
MKVKVSRAEECVCRSTRRDVLALASLAGLGAATECVTSALADPADERPKRGDLLVAVEGETRPLTPKDIPAVPLLAWPIDPKDNVIRNGSRLNKVLLVALDPATLVGATVERAAGGVVAYSAICPHAGCEVNGWIAEQRIIQCPCHESQYNPRDGAMVIDGPSPRALPALPLEIVDGKLTVAKPFVGRVGVIPV